MKRPSRHVLRTVAATPLTALFAILAVVLLLVAGVQFRSIYAANLRLFTVDVLERAARESAQAAGAIQPVLPVLLGRRAPQNRRDTEALREVLGEQPSTIDMLAVRVGDLKRIVPEGWHSAAPPGRDICKPAWHETSLWLAHRMLLLDPCAEIRQALLHHRMTHASIQQQQLVILQSLDTPERPQAAVLETSYSLARLLRHWNVQSRIYFLGLAMQFASILILLVAGWWLIIHRLQALQRSVTTAATLDPLWIPPRRHRSGDEIGKLERAVRKTLRSAALRQRRLQRKNETLERLRRFIAHEIRNPLQSLMAINAASPEALSFLRRIQYAVDEVLEDAAEEDLRDIEEKDLGVFVRRWVESLKTYRAEQLIAFSRPEVACPVRVNFEALEDALDHLYSNAHDFRLEGSHIEIRVGCNPPHGTITVRNLGSQIPEHMLPLIFNYGVTTRAHDPQHLGQGLFRANSLVSRMNGSVRAQNVPDGVEFTITLPLLNATTL